MPNNIFQIWESAADWNETQVYGKLNANIDWSIFKQVAEEKAEYKPLEIKLKTNKIFKKDLIIAPGCNGLISQKALELIGLDTFRDFISFPLTVNDVSYFALYHLKSLDCLDKENSPHTVINTGNTEFGFWEMERFSFHLNKIKENTVFTIPETDRNLYCTEEIGRKILENNLVIVAQPLLYEEIDIRTNRVHYSNPILGISFEEPCNFKLDCKQIEKLKLGKKLSDKDWQIKTVTPIKDEYILELRQFELLKSNDWLQKSEVYIHVTARNPENIFKDRNAIKKQDIRLDFDCRINEYEWETTCIAPFKDGLSYVVIIVHRNDDKKYYEMAKEVFRNIKFTYSNS